jgi:DNA-binding beta-propeller fold protein YncE
MMLFSSRLGQAQARLVQAGAVLLAGALVAGCGAGYRPVISPINPSGPGSQPSSFAAVVSSPSPTTPGEATIIDYAGDTIMAQAPIGPGPKSFSMDGSGSNGYTVNSDGTLTNFPISSTLQQKQVQYTTLPSTPCVANNLVSTTDCVLNMYTPNAGMWAADLRGNVTDVLTGFPQTLKLAIPVAPTPLMVIGPGSIGQRNYVISQNFTDASGVACNVSPHTVAALGEADAIETASFTVSARIPLGKCPVYAVQSSDFRRLFVLNRGDDTLTVINSQNNTPDSCTPFQNQSGQWITCHPSISLPAGPIYAEYVPITQQLVVANYDSNTISVIDVPLDEYGNDANTYANGPCTTYAACGAITGGFGTVHTVSVGANPASVTVLADGSRAYTANQADGTVSLVNLASYSLVKTLPVNGHPRTVVSTQNSLYGKVYVASPDSPYLTIVRTDQDIIDATVLVQGNIVDVRVTSPSGSGGNVNVVSRKPGFGQACYLPPTLLSASTLGTDPGACSRMP